MNSVSLFDTEGKMLTMAQLTEVIDYIADTKPMQYVGKGNFERFTVEREKGLSDSNLQKLSAKYPDLTLPEDYIELMKYSNGLSFYEYADIRVFPLEEALGDTEEEFLENKLLHFATCREDYFYIKCDGSERNIYYSAEGIEEPQPLNMSLLAFLEAGLISGFSYFWLWGDDNYDLY